jgi:DNA polymerase III sliding clamp (beta) subunit (PCNA family)
MILNLKALKAVALFCSKEETRYYLKGVNLQFRSDHIIMIATNGHYLTMLRQKLDEPLDTIPPDTIVPIEFIDTIKLSKHLDVAELYIEAGRITVTYCGATYSSGSVAASFPDTKRIIPSSVSGETAQFDVAYPALYQKAAKMFRKDGQVKIAHNGENPALVDWFEPCDGLQAFGVLMPMRARSFAKAPPEWADVYIPVMMQAAE